MSRIPICTAGAAAVAVFALAPTTWGQCAGCPGGTPEGEPCIVDGGADVTNAGCNNTVPVFTNVSGPYPEVICGVASTFVAAGGGDSRDTDWYLVSQADLIAADADADGWVQILSTLQSEFPGVTFIIDIDDNTGVLCSATTILEIGSSPQSCGVPVPAKATLLISDHPNGIVVFASTGNPDGSAIFTGFGCPTGNNDYTLEIDVFDAPAPCGAAGTGDCATPTPGIPGCSDEICCKDVCDQDSFCCQQEWDENCVQAALDIGCVCDPTLEGVLPPASDNFDSYANGMLLSGVNGWGGWDDTAGAVAAVSNAQSLSAPNSVAIDGADDQVQQYTDFCEGKWNYTVHQFVPNNFTGISYFILLNTYTDGGPKNWSVQVQFNATTNTIVSDFDGATLPLVRGQWQEILVEIDLDLDTQSLFYGGNLLYTKSWVDGVSGGGEAFIRAVDLFANTGSVVYYDNLSLVEKVDCPWDCELVPNGVVGTSDLLALLATWGLPGSCDFDGGGVGTSDLLKLLANWGACP